MKKSSYSWARAGLLAIVLLLVAPAFWACSTHDDNQAAYEAAYQAALAHQEKYKAIDDTIIQGYLHRHQITNYTRTNSGLYVVPLTTGTGTLIKVGSQVTVTYEGKFVSAATENTVFDRSGSTNFIFTAGYTNLIPGWTEGALRLRQGDRALLIMPSYLAYGPTGYATIPADTPLLFDMNVLTVTP